MADPQLVADLETGDSLRCARVGSEDPIRFQGPHHAIATVVNGAPQPLQQSPILDDGLVLESDESNYLFLGK